MTRFSFLNAGGPAPYRSADADGRGQNVRHTSRACVGVAPLPLVKDTQLPSIREDRDPKEPESQRADEGEHHVPASRVTSHLNLMTSRVPTSKYHHVWSLGFNT